MLFAEYHRFYARFFVLFVAAPVVSSLSLREDCSASHAGHIWRDTGKGHLYSSCLVNCVWCLREQRKFLNDFTALVWLLNVVQRSRRPGRDRRVRD